jgi:hypothetical protein
MLPKSACYLRGFAGPSLPERHLDGRRQMVNLAM